jgi:hypothetical protein
VTGGESLNATEDEAIEELARFEEENIFDEKQQ